MAYSINRTSDSSSGYNVSDGQIRDDFFSISLIGKGFSQYGEIIQENLLHIMENFSYSVSPPNPTPGQLWHNSSTNDLYMWQEGGGWVDLRQPLAGRIFNEHINADAKIASYKLAPTLPGRILVGDINASAIPTWVDMTGDVLIDAYGNTQIQANTINTTELGSIIDQDMTFGIATTNSDRNLNVVAHDAYVASVNVYGTSQGSGRLYVGQSITQGGGVMYNGDNNPVLPGSVDYVSHFRRNAGVDTEVFRYLTTSDQVDFIGEITTPRVRTGLGGFTFLEDNYLQLQANGSPRIELRSQDGGLPYIDFSNGLSGDYDARLQLLSDDILQVIGSDFNVGDTSQVQNTTIRALAADAYIASIEAYGASQGTGRLYLGQSSTVGGGIIYNGDADPVLTGTIDHVSHFRRNAGIDYEVLRYSYLSNDVYFTGNVTLTGALFVNDTNTRVTEGTGNAVRMQTNFGYIDIGPQSTTYGHIETDRATFYMNKPLEVTTSIKLYSTNTQLSNGALNLEASGNPSIEIRSSSGGTPYIDFSNDAVADYDARLVLANDSTLSLLGSDLNVPEGKIRVGSTPNDTWGAGTSVLELNSTSALIGDGTATYLSENVYYNSGWKYQNTDSASMIGFGGGTMSLTVAPSGTADTAITWTTALRIESGGDVKALGGNVLISPDAVDFTPTFELDIHGAASDSYVHFTNTATGTTSGDGFLVGIDSTGAAAIYQRETLPINFMIANTVRGKIAADGKWLISPNSVDFNPGRELTVHSTGIYTYSQFTTTTTGTTLNDGLLVGYDNTEGATFWNQENTGMRFGVNGAQRLKIQAASGNVLISPGGTDFTPASELVIYDAASTGAYTQYCNLTTGTTSGDGFFVGINDNEQAVLHNTETTDILFYTANNLRGKIDANGNWLISPNNVDINPNRELVVYSTNTYVYSQFVTATTGTTSIDGFAIGYEDVGGATLWNFENTGFRIGTNSTNRFTITADGKTAMGTAAIAAPSCSVGGLDISSGEVGLLIGAEDNAQTRTANTNKYGVIGVPRYGSGAGFNVISGEATSTNNTVVIGGGSNSLFAATKIDFKTGTGLTDPTPDTVGYISASGLVWGTPTGGLISGAINAALIYEDGNRIKAPDTYTGYTGGQNTYIHNDVSDNTSFNAVTNIGAAWESVGPTGSGATNIWTALDILPSGTRAIILKIRNVAHIYSSLDSNSYVYQYLYARKSGSVIAVDQASLISEASSAGYSQANFPIQTSSVTYTTIPINNSSNSFELYRILWTQTSAGAITSNNICSCNLVGWIGL